MTKAPTPVRVLIVDDEPAARELLREMLRDEVTEWRCPNFRECEDGVRRI